MKVYVLSMIWTVDPRVPENWFTIIIQQSDVAADGRPLNLDSIQKLGRELVREFHAAQDVDESSPHTLTTLQGDGLFLVTFPQGEVDRDVLNALDMTCFYESNLNYDDGPDFTGGLVDVRWFFAGPRPKKEEALGPHTVVPVSDDALLTLRH